MPDQGFREVKVVLHPASGAEQAWLVDVEEKAAGLQLLADLLQALQIPGDVADYDLRVEPPLDRPVIFITAKPRIAAKNPRRLDQAGGQ